MSIANYMTEIARMVDGVVKNDRERAITYANHLADSLDEDGFGASANRIRKILQNGRPAKSESDLLTTKPESVGLQHGPTTNER